MEGYKMTSFDPPLSKIMGPSSSNGKVSNSKNHNYNKQMNKNVYVITHNSFIIHKTEKSKILSFFCDLKLNSVVLLSMQADIFV